MATLVVMSGPLEGRRIDVTSELVLGRDAADVAFEDTEVSRRHAAIRPTADGLEIEDLSSRNGTRVDGVRITEVVALSDGAVLRVGQTTIRVELPVPEVAAEDPGATRTSDVSAEAGATVTSAAPDSGPATEVGRPAAPRRERPRETEPGRAASPARGAEFGAFAPTAPRRHRGAAATRLWVPAALTYMAIAGTAAGLVLYFAGR